MLEASCPLCGCEDPEPRHPMPDGATIHVCAGCDVWMRLPMLTPDERKKRYSDPSYFSKVPTPGSRIFGYNDYLRDRHLHYWVCNLRLEQLEALVPPGRLLDVGCGPGVLLDAARIRGWEPRGVDLSSWAAGVARSHYNLDVLEGELAQTGLADASFDLINLDDVLEHVPDPRALLEDAARLLRPGGVLSIGTPDAGSLSARLLRGRWFHFMQEEHLVFFTRNSLRRLVEALGLEVVSIGRSPRMVDLRFLFKRLTAYDNRISDFLLALARPLPPFGFPIYTGEMRLIVRKPSASEG